MHNNKRKRIILIIIILIVLIIIAAGITYAAWLINRSQTVDNIVTAKCLDVSITSDTNGISLQSAFPISDEDAEALTPYTFTITNNCENDIVYELALESIGNAEESLSPTSLKLKFDDKEADILGNYESINTTLSDAYAAYRLQMGKLSAKGEPGDTETHEIKLWMDYDTPNSEGGKTYTSKITISVGQDIKKIICSAVSESELGNVPTGEFNYGDEYICNFDGTNEYHFFVIEDGDNTSLIKGETGTAGPKEVSLIMDRNYTDSNVPKTMTWCDPKGEYPTTNACNHDLLDKYLVFIQEKFGSWVEVNLPTKYQLQNSNGNNTFLYDYLDMRYWKGIGDAAPHHVLGLYGYWATDKDNTNRAWYIDCTGYRSTYPVLGGGRALRPVITISKDSIE